MKHILLLCLCLLSYSTFAQPTLKPSIGIGSLPSNSDPICTIPVYTGDFDTVGHDKGDTIPDFTLYTPNGTAVNMQTALTTGKPVLLVNGSLTCPVFRGKIADINNIAATYNSNLQVYIVYTVEAHPTDPSPYSGTIWVTGQNQNAGILYPQPTTYGERKALVDTLTSNYSITPEILIDGPCNNWWASFGPAPNNAYLIDTNGVVFEKHGWFHKAPDDMYCAIDSLLGLTSNCSSFDNNGSFTFSYVNDTISYGSPGDILTVYSTLTNSSSTDNVVIDILRMQENIPINWATSMCIDVCLPTNVSQTQVTIPPSQSQSFTMYFYTDPNNGGLGNTEIGFRNANNFSNQYRRMFYSSTDKITSSPLIESDQSSFKISPTVSSSGVFQIELPIEFDGTLNIIDINGSLVESHLANKQMELDLGHLTNGLYWIQSYSSKEMTTKPIIIQK
ncbi:MAG: T9SS type A sorting domain-containing protein [Aureispira sp.]|nr:T9SS type A sorting domain-containing protein [Aureispira sp.]